MGPRRIFVAFAVLAFVAITLTAGAAVASGDDGSDHGWHGKDRGADIDEADHGGRGGDLGGADEGPNGEGPNGEGRNGEGNCDRGDVDGAGTGSGSGTVTGSGAGSPPAPVEAPAAAPSGPAPDGAAAAPASGPATDAFVAAAGITDAPGVAVPAPVGAPVAGPTSLVPAARSGLEGLGDLPVLGSIGALAGEVTDGSSGARALLSSGPGRSLATIGVLGAAIALFLSVHRRTDRGDRKLASAPRGPDVARFR